VVMAVINSVLIAVLAAITALLRDREPSSTARPGTQLDAAPLSPDKHPPDQMSAPSNITNSVTTLGLAERQSRGTGLPCSADAHPRGPAPSKGVGPHPTFPCSRD
jgi:hypothetical protein